MQLALKYVSGNSPSWCPMKKEFYGQVSLKTTGLTKVNLVSKISW